MRIQRRTLGKLAAGAAATVAAPAIAQNKPFTIGFTMNLTGPLAPNGKAALVAMQIWESDINAKGGLLGRPVKLVFYDDQSTPSTVAGIYTKLLDVDRADLVVGGYATNMLVPSMPVVIQHNKVFLGLLGLGMIRAANEAGLKTKIFGGGMVGLQSTSIKAQLGPMLNGILNYDFWLPVPKMHFEGVDDLIKRYQEKAAGEGIDPFGYYMAPWAYAYLQVLAQAVEAIKSLDDEKLGDYIRKSTFKTVVGDVKFGSNGEIAEPRVVTVQFHDVK